MLSHLFLQDTLCFEAQSSNCWEKKPNLNTRRAQSSTQPSRLFIENIIWKSQMKQTNMAFLFHDTHLSQSHFHDFFHTLNIILTLTFDSTVCKFASQMIFLHWSVLQTRHWMPPESLSVITLPFWAVFKEQTEWDLFQTKWEWVCLVILTAWRDLHVPGYAFVY